MIGNKPLSEKELTELQEFLLSDSTPESCMDIEMLDGFLTAIVSGPETIMPSEWVPVVWGDKDGPVFDTEDQAQKITTYIYQHMNGIAAVLMQRPEDFEPLIHGWEEDEFQYEALAWSNGYMRAVNRKKNQWKLLLSDDEHGAMIMPILTLMSRLDDPDFGELINTSEKRERFIEMLPGAVCSIYDFWLERRTPMQKPNSQAVKKEKIGRNAPCPCGSGKKYKKCCGSPEKLN